MIYVIDDKLSSITKNKMNQNRKKKKRITLKSQCLTTGELTPHRQSNSCLMDPIYRSGHPPLTVFFFNIGKACHGTAQLFPHCVHVP